MYKRDVTLLASAARSSSSSFEFECDYNKAAFYISATAAGSSLDVVIEEQDAESEAWFVIGTFAQLTGTGSERIVIDPVIGRRLRVKYTLSGSFTFSVGMAGLCE